MDGKAEVVETKGLVDAFELGKAEGHKQGVYDAMMALQLLVVETIQKHKTPND